MDHSGSAGGLLSASKTARFASVDGHYTLSFKDVDVFVCECGTGWGWELGWVGSVGWT